MDIVIEPADPPDPDPHPPPDPPKEDASQTLCAADELPPAQARALLAMLSQPTIKQAAETANVGERTLHAWLEKDRRFVAALRRARRQAFSHAMALAQQCTAMAVTVLAKIMTDTSAPHAARASAAMGILKFGRDALGLDDLAERVEVLEDDLRGRP